MKFQLEGPGLLALGLPARASWPPAYMLQVRKIKKGLRKCSARFLAFSNKILSVQKLVLSSSQGQDNIFEGLRLWGQGQGLDLRLLHLCNLAPLPINISKTSLNDFQVHITAEVLLRNVENVFFLLCILVASPWEALDFLLRCCSVIEIFWNSKLLLGCCKLVVILVF